MLKHLVCLGFLPEVQVAYGQAEQGLRYLGPARFFIVDDLAVDGDCLVEVADGFLGVNALFEQPG